MRHGRKVKKLGRTASHRKAMLANMATSLILHKRIKTTVAKAKALRQFVEPLITRAKPANNTNIEVSTHNRRIAFAYLRNKEAVKELFANVGEKVGDRPGGYTRIIRLGYRPGDAAEVCLIELVDFNETLLQAQQESTTKKKRTRRSSKKSAMAGEPNATTEQTSENAASHN